MADDNSARYRSNDSFGRGPAEPASDPLAELARLIGQNDPYTGQGRDARPPAQHETDARYAADPIPSFLTTPAPRYESDPVPESEPAPRYSAPAPQQYEHNPVSGHSSAFPTHNDWPGATGPEPLPSKPAYRPRESFEQPAAPYSPQAPAPHYSGQSYASPAYADPHGRPGDFYQPDLPGFDASGNPAPADRQGYGAPLYPYAPDTGTMPPPSDDEFYDEPRGGRRKGLLTVAAVLALAVVGTAGAFGYRSLFGSQGSSGPPPVIRASGEPSKVAPPPVVPDQAPGKFSYDRFGDAGKDEQVVRREEKPVDLSKAAAPPPRTVLPAAPFANAPAPKATATAANPPSALGEPRRVRTVPIRPDQGGDVASAPPMSAAPPRQTNAPSPPATRPADVAQAPDDAPRAAAPRPSARVALRSPPAAAAAANAPLSLSPDANNSPPPPAAQERLPPPQAIAPPARVASAPASGGGSYLVQVSSQRSEADAETAYRGIQSKYSSVLGSQAHTVRRADLGTKGVYYRAMVGPFASREQAVQLCSSLKQAGGDCVVQH